MKKVAALSLFLILGSLSLTAHDVGEEQVVFNSIPLSSESQVLVEQIEKQKEESQESTWNSVAQYLQVAQEALAKIDMQSFAEYVISAFPQENMLKLDDGSDWTVDQSDIRNLRYWKAGHIVLLYPRPGDKDKPFMFYNQSINRTLHVNPYAGPTRNGPKTNTIRGIDPNLGHIFVMSGSGKRSSWAIDKTYWSLFQEWAVHEPVIIANYNKNWRERYFPHFFPSYDFVLINVTNASVIPVKPL